MASTPPTVQGRSLRDVLTSRWGALKLERESWVQHWQALTEYLLPASGRYIAFDRNRGRKKHGSIYDNTASRALSVMTSGLMAGASSPARKWFRLTTADPELAKFHPVRVWLDDSVDRMMRVFQASNTYTSLHQMYSELGCFGTTVSIVLPDYENVIHHYPVTTGQYALAHDFQGRVTTMFRECEKTVGELVKEFGKENCSQSVRDQFQRGDLDNWVTILHVVEPRADRDTDKADARNMPWRSVYFEVSGDNDQILRESGFERFPVLAPRWNVTGGDVYGHSPGMEALGDIRGLQHKQLRLAQVIDYQTKPPLQVPTALKNRDVNTLPGGFTFADTAGQQAGIRPLWEVALNPQHLLENIRDDRNRISRSFFEDLFLMLANSTDQSKTATEVAMLQEEKMVMLGPVLERLQNELHEPLVNLTFARMLEVGALLPPPEELQGTDLRVEFVSMLAQAQRAIGTNAIDRFMGNLGAAAQLKPDVLDVVDFDKWAYTYVESLGVPSDLLVDERKVQALREARNRALAAKEQVAAMQQQAAATKDLAASPTGGAPNALTDLMNNFSGYNSPTATEV